MDENVRLFYEIMGLSTRPRAARRTTSTSGPGAITISHCARLRGWQQTIVNDLNTGQDSYIIVSPGGGKTLPVTCFWVQTVLGVNILSPPSERELLDYVTNFFYNLGNIPKLMYLVPTRKLALEAMNGFREILASLLGQIINWFFTIYDSRNRHHYDIMQNIFVGWISKNSSVRGINFNDFFSELSALLSIASRGHSRVDERRISYYNNIIERTCINYLDTSLIYLQTGGQATRGRPDNFPVIVAVYQSAQRPDILKVTRQTRFVICDEAHELQPVSVHSEDPNQAEDRAFALYNVLHQLRNVRNAQLAFLSGTQHPGSAKQFAQYLNDHFNRKFRIQSIQTRGERNPAHIEVIPDNRINQTKHLVENITQNINRNIGGNLYVILSKKRISVLAQEVMKQVGVDLDAVIHAKSSEDRFQQTTRRRGQEPETFGMSPERISRIGAARIEDEMGRLGPRDAHRIQNDFIRLAVSHGIGIIARDVPGEQNDQNADMVEMPDGDKEIVADLFKTNKLKVLLATTAVGIGVNIDVFRIYLPSIEKWSSVTQQNEKIILRDLAQLIHRAGRGATTHATVYTPQENVQRVSLAVNQSPDFFEPSRVVPHVPGEYAFTTMYLWMHNLVDQYNRFAERVYKKHYGRS